MPLFSPKYFCITLLLLIPTFSFTQTPLLERPITLKVSNEKIPNVLELIAKQGNFSFSYNSDLVKLDSRINLWVSDKPFREVLNHIFKGFLTFKVSKNYIILQKTEPSLKYLEISDYNLASWQVKPFNKIPNYRSISSSATTTLWIGFQMGIRIRSR